jgi:O-antigen/teichoic acid export membrane protein
MSLEFAQTAVWRAASAASSVFAALISFKLYQKFLSVETFGLVQAALMVVRQMPLFDGGFRTAVNRGLLSSTATAERRPLVDFIQWFNTGLALAAAGVGVAAMMAYRWTPNARVSGESLAFFVSLGLLAGLVLLAAAQSQVLIGLGAQRQMFIINAGTPWINLLALWWGFRQGWGAWAFVGSQAVTGLAVFGAVGLVLRSRDPEAPLICLRPPAAWRDVFHRLKGEAVRVLACQASSTLLYMSDVILVSAVIAGPDAGRFVLMTQLFTILRSILQSADDAFWPVMAARAGNGAELSQLLGRLNAWLHGATMTAASLTLPVFVRMYLGPEWEPAAWMVAWMGLRNVITGLASQPAAYLYGTGRFPTLAWAMFRELVLAVVLGWVGSRLWGATGIAAGFLAATVGGTLLPLPVTYARLHQWNPAGWLASSWTRAVLAMGLTGLLCTLLLRTSPGIPGLIVGAGLAAATVLAVAVTVARWRGRRRQLALLPALVRYL